MGIAITKEYKKLLAKFNVSHGERVRKGSYGIGFIVGYTMNKYGVALILAPERRIENSWTMLTSDDHVDESIKSKYGYMYAVDVRKI